MEYSILLLWVASGLATVILNTLREGMHAFQDSILRDEVPIIVIIIGGFISLGWYASKVLKINLVKIHDRQKEDHRLRKLEQPVIDREIDKFLNH